jgi:hypothetical protein
MSKITKELISLYKKGKENPTFFVENVIGMTTLWKKQQEIINSVQKNARTAVRSCNGAGKTFVTANTVTWFLATHPNSIVVSTAPTARQVRELLWQEINNIHQNSKYPLGGRCLNVSWTMGAKWFAVGLSTNDANRFQGFHADNILGVIDEAAGVEAPIWEGMDAILTSSGARLLVIGNPTEPSGRFFDAFSSDLYNKIHISAFDTPNFTENGITYEDIKSGEWRDKMDSLIFPSLITPRWVAEHMEIWGEDSPAFQARVMGNFPIIGTDTMIPLGWVLRAKERELDFKDKDRVGMAIDVARFGDDESVIGIRKGNSLTSYEVLNNVDVYALAKAAKKIADREKPETIKVDVVGIGAGVADILRAWGYQAIDYVAQERAWNASKFVNRRTESWFLIREKFRNNEINLPADEKLVGQLTAPKYVFDSAGRYKLESKEDIKKRGLESPDRADVVAMLFESEDDYDSYVAKDYENKEVKKGTVQQLLNELTQGEEGELQWHTMKL